MNKYEQTKINKMANSSTKNEDLNLKTFSEEGIVDHIYIQYM